MPHAVPAIRSTWPRRLRTVAVWTVSVLLVAAVLALAIAYMLWRGRPASWYAHQQWLAKTPAARRLVLADALEERLSHFQTRTRWSQACNTAVPPDIATPAELARWQPGTDVGLDMSPTNIAGTGRRTLVIRTNELNSWLTQRLPQWLAHHDAQLPREISQPAVSVSKGLVTLSFQYASPRLTQVLTFRIRPEMVPQAQGHPQLRLTLEQALAGRLPLPPSRLESLIAQNAGARDRQAVQSILAALQGHQFDPALPVPGDRLRTVRLDGFEFLPGNEGVKLDTQFDPTRPGR